MDKTKVIYVAGKYRGISANEVWENIAHARAEARKLWLKGWACICPHTNSLFMDGADGETDNLFMEGDLEILRRCDSIFLLNNWQESEGAMREYELAVSLGLEIFYEED